MTLPRSRTAVLGAILVAVLLLTGARAALSSPSLPPIDADELVASVLERAGEPEPISGELAATLGLGLPTPPDEDSPMGALLGESRLRLERSEDGVRAALLGERSERLVVTDGRTLTTWDSRTLEATRTALPEHDGDAGRRDLPEGLDPLAVAGRMLAIADAHADVTVDGTARVAGRPAYQLVMTPTDPGTTLGRVEVDIDEETRTPLRWALFAHGAEAPSVEVAFTRVSFDPIDPATFAFTPPPGTGITERERPDHDADAAGPGPLALLEGIARATGGVGPVVADGFASVVGLPLPAGDHGEPAGERGEIDVLLPLDGPLLSVRTAEVDGERLALAGFVPLERLDEVAAQLPTVAP